MHLSMYNDAKDFFLYVDMKHFESSMVLPFLTGPGTIRLLGIHRFAWTVHRVRSEEGSRDKRTLHRRNHGSFQTTGVRWKWGL